MKFSIRMGLAAAWVLLNLTSIAHAGQSDFSVMETSHANPAAVHIFKSYFDAKSRKEVEPTMAYFRKDMLAYADTTLGWVTPGYDAQRKIFEKFMPTWGNGKSYPTRVIGGPRSAIVEFTDTPELFGGELHIVGAVDFKDGKIYRWADYWDSTGYDEAALQKIIVPKDHFPSTFREDEVGNNASPLMTKVAKGFQSALTKGDVAAAGDLLSYDAVYEDSVLHTQIIGRSAIQRYLSRILPVAPFGQGSTLRHIVGGDQGGGFEWGAVASSPVRVGITSLTLDSSGHISRVATVYDGRAIPPAEKEHLVTLSIDK
ncbi:nuclear transport factor 2 family protein [Paraburkholderia xenovorans]|uniref:hypothetical protein n=1 Tax=Paraburkholderia xenovorans TaxID=36873 RepID=UPI0038BB1247